VSFDLTRKRALVTGASKGIGAACADALARAGARVTTVARSGEVTIRHDALDHEGLAAKLAELEPHDILVNAVGTNEPAPLGEVTEESFDRVVALNLRAAFFVLQHAAVRLVDAGRPGSLITISSQMGHVGAPSRSVYCATKHALEGLTKAAAVELAPHRIRVNTIAPTFVETEMTRPMFTDPAFSNDVISRIPLRQLATPDDVGHAAVYLASDAARMVTGTSLLVDGGWIAR
jgi:NAD(P)-dependent dehydrogenase (short-subunit alcohol dehydrogenase family)